MAPEAASAASAVAVRLPGPRDKRRALVFMLAFYGLMALIAFVIRGLTFPGATSWWPTDDWRVPSWEPMLVALSVVAIVVLLARPMVRYEWSQRLLRLMQETFGRLTIGEALLIGVVSGISEEYLFRGALQPWAGPVIATLLFAVMHAIGYWWIFALVVGAIAAALYQWSGSLWPCIALHALINTINLYRQSRWDADVPEQRSTDDAGVARHVNQAADHAASG
ncbi:MAG: lysostaphin resistance A-like protein [Planctomycetota bacterium]